MSFKEDVTAFLLKNGTEASEGDWVYGWTAWNDKHENCSWFATDESEVVEYSFSSFTDTFSGNEDKTVLALTNVTCSCGKTKNTTIGLEGGAMELLHKLLGIKKEYRY